MTPSTMPGSSRRPVPCATQVGLDGPRCPACGSIRVVRPSAFDPHGYWRCLDCGAAWTTPTEPEPAARRRLSDPRFRWPPEGTL